MSTTTPFDAEELRQVVAEVLDVDADSVTDDADFVQDLGVDSLMALEVMVVLENTYHIKIAEDELKQMTTLRKVRDLVTTRIAETAG